VIYLLLSRSLTLGLFLMHLNGQRLGGRVVKERNL
jgi:hypothetical protein